MYELTADQRASVEKLETLAGTRAELSEYGNGYDPESETRYWLPEFMTPRGAVSFVIYPDARIRSFQPADAESTDTATLVA